MSDEGESEEIQRCDYCRLPIPKEAVDLEYHGDTYLFCSASCRDALTESESVFTEYHGHRRFRTGVSALDASLPQGVPRNSFVMLTDLAGTRTEAIQAELAWRALQRGEPVVFLSFLEPPISLIQTFVTLEWNVLPYLEDDQFHIIDCFTYRVDDSDRMFERMNKWNTHLSKVAQNACTRVRDPSEIGELESRLDSALEDHGMHDSGIVVIDSLTELGSLVQPVQSYNFLKDVRADVCKGRFVPIFAGATVTSDEEQFPHDLGYMVDGLIEMRLNDDLVENALIKQLRVRKMSGVLIYPEWSVYEYTSGKGIVTFDPVAEMDDERDGHATEAADGETVAETDSDAAAATDGETGDTTRDEATGDEPTDGDDPD
ncbi:MAG: ATPase domain-containing protein [Haloarculaceae archaeon]